MKKIFSGVIIGLVVSLSISSYAFTQFFPDVASNIWFGQAVGRLSEAGIITGYEDGTFKPNQSVSRAEMAVIIDRLLDKIESDQVAFQNTLNSQNNNVIEARDADPIVVKGNDNVIADTVDAVKESVVSILATKDFVTRDFVTRTATRETFQVGGGTGFIYSTNGLILTNKHVVSDTDASYVVVLYDGTQFNAEVVARDDNNDIAVMRINPADQGVKLKAIKLGDSSSIRVGERVIAIGNALAQFQNTVTTGIISALGRSIIASDGGGDSSSISNLLQTDAAINPGNSGGPLVNLDGEVIGMNTAVASNATGIGFAIPVDDVKYVAQVVQEKGRLVRPYIGVRYLMMTEEYARLLGVSQDFGALVISNSDGTVPAVIAGSPAQKAGVQEGDIILSIDGVRLQGENNLRNVVATKNVGQEIELTVLRGEDQIIINVVLEEAE